MSPASGNGVNYHNVTFRNWKGSEADGSRRGPIKVICPDGAPCTDITIEDFAMWTESGDSQWWACESAYGQGACLREGSGGAYGPTTTTIRNPPDGYAAPTMAADVQDSFGYTRSIPIPSIPTTFFPGVAPISTRASGGSTPTTTPSGGDDGGGGSSGSGEARHWAQCGGRGYSGPTACVDPYECVEQNQWYSQCL